MVYEVVWTAKAIESYASNIKYLKESWTEKEVRAFVVLVEKKINLLSDQPDVGTPRNKKQPNIRHTVLHKRIALIYRVKRTKNKSNCFFFGTRIKILPG